ncbi:sensor histidine kinase [Patescibacteria group bacterium]
MITPSLSLFLIVAMSLLTLMFFLLLFLFLRKDKQLIELKGKYEHLLKMESEHFKQNKQRDDYVAMMVHELRSPLSVIKGSADLVLREEKNLEEEQKYTLLSQIKESSNDLLDVVNDILDVSKIESGRFEVKKVKGDFNKVLQEEADYYMALARERDINVETKLPEDIPMFEFDEDRIKHVMNNFLSNALKFTDAGGTVTIESRVSDKYHVEVCVSDNGVGVPDELKGKLFNKFVQMENRKNTKEKGTGLGLVIAKGIVEAHGGSAWVEDNHPSGAKFLFTIPIANPE